LCEIVILQKKIFFTIFFKLLWKGGIHNASLHKKRLAFRGALKLKRRDFVSPYFECYFFLKTQNAFYVKAGKRALREASFLRLEGGRDFLKLKKLSQLC